MRGVEPYAEGPGRAPGRASTALGGENGGGNTPKISPFVARLRAFELGLHARMAEFQCSVHLCLGQEAVPDALHDHLRPEDWVFSTHRSHGHYLAKGGDPQRLLDEIEGRETGVNGGYSGSQSFCDPSINFHSTAVVGGLIGVATGTALGLKLKGSSAIVACCIGDAATEQGIMWESVGFAALHKLPVIYVCENNQYSVHAHISERQATPIGDKIMAFGLPYFIGVSELHDVLKLRSPLPAFVEITCERQCPHVSAMEDLRK